MFGSGSIEKRISEKFESFEGKCEAYLTGRIDGRLDALLEKFEEKFEASVSCRIDKRIDSLVEGFEKKLETSLSDHFDDRLNALIESSGEKIEASLSGRIDSRLDALIEGFEEIIDAYITTRLDALDDRLQQSIRQERRNQAALESVFENQNAGLSVLRGIRNESKALKELMAFVESFVLWRQSQPDSPEFHVLWAKLAALLDLFGLEVMAVNGVPFDPSLHEACAVRFDPNMPEGYVLETVRPGFTSGGEVLRCASVVINRFPVVTNVLPETETQDADVEDREFQEEAAENEAGDTDIEDGDFDTETEAETPYAAGEGGEFKEEPAETETGDTASDDGYFGGEAETDDRIGL
jgi:molecular chaperone GrpE (heat shock protein)